jgi:hypothetical protein
MIHVTNVEKCERVVEVLSQGRSLPIWKVANVVDMPIWSTIAIVETLVRKGHLAVDEPASVGQPVKLYRAVQHRKPRERVVIPEQAEEWAAIFNMVKYGRSADVGMCWVSGR